MQTISTNLGGHEIKVVGKIIKVDGKIVPRSLLRAKLPFVNYSCISNDELITGRNKITIKDDKVFVNGHEFPTCNDAEDSRTL